MKVRLSVWTLLVVATAALTGCHAPGGHNLPPAQQLQHPGPGVGGPGAGVIMAGLINSSVYPPGAPGVMGGMMIPPPMITSQVLFPKPEGMQIRWITSAEGKFDSVPLIAPGRHEFPQGRIYPLKLTNIPAREGVELYPTLEILAATPRTEAFLAHNAVPVQFTEEDLDQVLTGNFVTKVIYLPDPEFQELALAGVETLVSTRLDPGIDPIVEADRRGAILAVIRLGNRDREMPGNPSGSVIQASFRGAHASGAPSAFMPGRTAGYPMPPGFVAGVTAPPYGMPMSGTPIGLAGPPHIPLGIPAGLQKHVMKNHTRRHIPEPTRNLRIDVTQQPGFSYPRPVDRVRIVEQNFHPTMNFHQPADNKYQLLP